MYETKLSILFLIAAEQKVRAPQTMPEVKTDQNILEAGGCSWRDEVVDNGYTWNPRVLPFGEVQCVSCTCKVSMYLLSLWLLVSPSVSVHESNISESTCNV